MLFEFADVAEYDMTKSIIQIVKKLSLKGGSIDIFIG